MTNHLHEGDLPDLARGPSVAVDSETMGLRPGRDPLCVVQLSAGDGSAHVVAARPDLRRAEPEAAADRSGGAEDLPLRPLRHRHVLQHLGVLTAPVYCTKIASKLARTYTDRHGLKDVVRELLNVDLSKAQQSSDWGSPHAEPGPARLCGLGRAVPARAEARLDAMLEREGRMELAQACFELPAHRAELDLRAGTPRTFSRIPERGKGVLARLPPRFGHSGDPFSKFVNGGGDLERELRKQNGSHHQLYVSDAAFRFEVPVQSLQQSMQELQIGGIRNAVSGLQRSARRGENDRP